MTSVTRNTLSWLVCACLMQSAPTIYAQEATDWPGFRGLGARGVAEGFPLRTAWNADSKSGELEGVLWQIPIPGLGHSSPVVFGDKVFLITAIADAGEAELQVGPGGNTNAAEDGGSQSWVVFCFDKTTGQEIWSKTAHQGPPKATRHTKATHANTSVCVDGQNVLVFLGSEGMYCYDMAGNLRWSRDLGVIDVSKYGIGWGYASSPALFKDRIAIVCDDPKQPYAAVLSLKDGQELWRVSRSEICERSWGTPLLHTENDTTQMIVNGWPWIVSYDLATGKELWRIEGGGDNPVPTPFEAHGWIYITNAHGGKAPIYVIKPDARGDLSAAELGDSSRAERSADAIVWSNDQGGCYMSTPVVYGDYLYLGNSNGVLRCFHAKTGEKIYEERLGAAAGVIASLVAADGKVICASENGTVYVLRPGPKFEVLAKNSIGEPCFATPAISADVLYIRSTKRLIAIK